MKAGGGPGHGRPAEAVPFGVRVLAEWSWRVLLIAGAAVVFARVAAELRLVVLPVVLAVFLTVLLEPLQRRLVRVGLPTAAAAAAAVAALVASLGAALGLLVPAVAGELDTLRDSVEGGVREILEWVGEGPLNASEAQVQALVDTAAGRLEENAATVGSGVLAGAALAAEVMAGLLLAVVVTFFLLKDGDRLWAWLLRRAGDGRREALASGGERVWGTLGAYLRGMVVVAAFDAAFIGLALVLVGVPLALPLTVLTFIGAFVPIVGATVAGAAATCVALVAGGPDDALIVLAAVVAVQQLESQLLSPVVIGRATALHPGVVLLAVTAGAVVFGVIGAAIAAPLAAIARAAATPPRAASGPSR